MEKIIKRYIDLLYADAGIIRAGATKSGDGLDGFTLEFDGKYWRYFDLDPTSPTTSYWEGTTFLHRIKTEVAKLGTSFDPKSEFGKKLISAIDYWLDNDFRNPNWWHNEIGIPDILSDICLMLEPYLTEKQLDKALEIIPRGSKILFTPEIGRWTGANLIWGAWISTRYYLLKRDPQKLAESIAIAANEITVMPGLREGIKRDSGFFQHGTILYSGGYGRSFTSDISRLTYILSGSEYQVSPEKLEIFCHHVLDGQRRFSCSTAIDFNVIGREISRCAAVGTTDSILPALHRMRDTIEMPRKSEINEYIAMIENKTSGNVDSPKYFNTIKYLTNNRPGFYIGVRGSDKNMRGGEICNGENMLAKNLSYGGSMCAMTDGDEYINIIPVWDYAKIPGTTSIKMSDEELAADVGNWASKQGQNETCVGASNDKLGIMSFKNVHDGLSFDLTQVAYPGGMIFLGHGITCKSGRQVITTLDQCAAKSPKLSYEDVSGEVTVPADALLTNGGFSYYRLDGGDMTVTVKDQTGSWLRNNLAESDTEITLPVFTAYIDHGIDPEDAYFAYAVEFTGAKDDTVKPVEITDNDKLTSVKFSDGSEAVILREACEYTLANGIKITGTGAYIAK